MNLEHVHEWRTYLRIDRAPIDPDGHTSFIVLACECNVATIFPAFNFLLTTRQYRSDLTAELSERGLRLLAALDDAALDELRAAVQNGAGHDCDEWIGPRRQCLLCGADL